MSTHERFLSSDWNATELALAQLKTDNDTNWLMFGACLVFLMQCGFCMLEAGSVSAKNTKNIMVKNMLDACLGCCCWWLIGFGIAFGDAEHTRFGGNDGFAFNHEKFSADEVYSSTGGHGSGYQYASFFFQFAFAATTATIVSGAVAERIAFEAYCVYAVCLVSIIYPVVVCLGWNAEGTFSAWGEEDRLFGCGALDFAGSGVVHLTGGVAALVGCIICGPRNGRFSPSGEVNPMPEQNPVLQTLGLFILWFGWFGFNGVSTLYIAGYSGVAAKVMVVTTIGAASGGLTSVIIQALKDHTVSHTAAINGILAGLVSVTGSCAAIEPYAAFIIGICGGFIYHFVAGLLLKCKIDDVLGAFPVHGACGIWGVVAGGLFATADNYANAYYSTRADKCAGIFYGGDGSTLLANVCFILTIICWTGAMASIMFATLNMFGKLRLSDEDQMIGLDIVEHGGPSYPEFALVNGGYNPAMKKVASDLEINPPSSAAASH